MDDMGTPPHGSKVITAWIHRQIKNGRESELVADELLKLWEKSQLLLDGRQTVGEFCLACGFVAPLISTIRRDLISGNPLPWGIVTRVLLVTELERDIIDSLFSGATRDKQLLICAAAGLQAHHPDPRWEKVLKQELKERGTEARRKRDQLFHDLKIFQQERMEEEVRNSIEKILKLFPEDAEAKKLTQTLQDKNLEQKVERLRKDRTRRIEKILPQESWPELKEALTPILGKADLEQAYHLSIALHQMELFEDALDALQTQRPQWTIRERLWEIEILLELGHFAEALGQSQQLLSQYPSDPDVTPAALYFSAKAYYGLEDKDQARSLLNAIIKFEPFYRDASVLLIEWEDEPL